MLLIVHTPIAPRSASWPASVAAGGGGRSAPERLHTPRPISGTGTYTFMIWATQGSPSLFRIQITDSSGATVYDNGVQQPIGGGSIIVHP